ncbi:hypothetical protein [Deinococcus xinjiangensis]|uniref:hypothetical protein n=1 Tax=Deinococcus xinjiangensis TaxID=457454 RepID=UPI003365A0D0
MGLYPVHVAAFAARDALLPSHRPPSPADLSGPPLQARCLAASCRRSARPAPLLRFAAVKRGRTSAPSRNLPAAFLAVGVQV